MTDLDTRLSAAVSGISTEVARSDTKSGLLLTLDGLLVAALSLQDSPARAGALVLTLTVLAATAVTTSVGLAVYVIRPRIGIPGRADPSFVTWSTATAEEIAESLADDRRLERIGVLSRIAMRKMRALRWSADAALVAVVTTAAALIAS